MSRNLCLIGMPGAGKSRIGAILADRLGRRLADSDDELCRWTGKSIPELFAVHGEAGFRRLECRVVEELATYHDLVVSLGGGAVLDDDNVAALLLTGVLVYLDVAPDVLVERLEGDTGRPLLAGDLGSRLHATHAERAPRYRAVADTHVDASKAPEAVADDVITWALAQGDVLTPSEHEQVMT